MSFFEAGNPNGSGGTTFSFDLNGTENTLTGFSTCYDAEYFYNANFTWADDFTTQVTQFVVPEPASLAVFGLGLFACMGLRRRRV